MSPIMVPGESGTLVSSVPGVFTALLNLIRTVAEEQSPSIAVFPFELGQYEPASYVMLSEIKGPRYEWESIGNYAQREIYDITGKATVFSGDSAATNATLAVTVLEETFALFQTCVMTPVITNRDMPTFGTAGPTPFLVLPLESAYTAGPGNIGGGQGGWCGVIEWGFHFEAVLTPS
jgi:hypothetical protein